MNGKITMSRSGSTGSASGIFGGASSSLWSRRRSSFIGVSLFWVLRFHGDDGLPAAPVLQPGDGDGQEAVAQPGLRAAQVERQVELDHAREAALRPLHAEEAGGARRARLPPLSG